MKSSDAGPPHYSPPSPGPHPDLERVIALEQRFAGSLNTRKPYATIALIGVCVVVFLIESHPDGPLYQAGANNGGLVLRGQIWRLWSCTFLHGGMLHIAANMYSLWVLGPFIERVLGTPRFVALYAICGLGGSMATAFLFPQVVSVGASGAIWGLMAAAFGLSLRPGSLLPPLTAQNMKRRLIQPLIINLAISFSPGIDKSAHFGGGAVGFVLAVSGILGLGARPHFAGEVESAASRTGWTVLAVLLSLGMLASLGLAMVIAFLAPTAG